MYKYGSIGLLSLTLLCGCGGPSVEPKAPVKGQVMLGNKPLPQGEISFSTPGKPPEKIEIKDGVFEGEVTLGKKRVEIYAYRKVKPPPTATDPVDFVLENYIAPQFNANTKLEAEVSEGGENQFTYSVLPIK